MERKIFTIILAVFLVAICILLGTMVGKAEECYILCRPGTVVNVHSKPNKGSPVTAWVECGQIINIDREKNGYAFVTGLASEIPDGWVYTGYIVDEQPVIEEYKAEIWEGPVIARRCVNGKRICTMRDGKTVTVYAKTHTWAVTNRGFIMCDWLRRIDD